MNSVSLMGRMTKDPALTYTQAKNTAVCKFTLAVDRQFTPQGEDKQADFINCVAWDKTAEFVNKYFTKGLRVAVVGRLQTRSWEAEGKKHWATEVIAESVYFADAKREQRGDAYEPPAMPEQTSDDVDQGEDSDGLPF